MKRKLKINLIIILICFMSFLGGYVKVINLPSYAVSIPEGYTQVTDKDKLTDAFLAYCKSRDSELSSSVLGASASYAYSVIVNASESLGISITDLQASLYYLQETTGLKWYMKATGLQGFNDIFAYLIQEEDLEVGQPADKIVYSGRTFTDADGNTCLVYVLPTDYNWNNSSVVPVYFGSYYKYNTSDLVSFAQNHITPVYNLTSSKSDSTRIQITTVNRYYNPIYAFYDMHNCPEQFYCKSIANNTVDLQGYRIIGCLESDPDTLYFGSYNFMYRNDDPMFNDFPSYNWQLFWTIDTPDSQLTNVNIYSPTITNQYIGDTIINNEGDIIYNDSDDDDDDDDWDPTVPVIPPAGGGTGNNNTINWPDIDIPDFNLPDFSLGDITDKFPFSIPFDLVALLTVLDGEPIAPHIEGTIPLGDFYTWNLDFDFSQFDNYARIFRAFEFIGFCIGLIYFTVRIVKG